MKSEKLPGSQPFSQDGDRINSSQTTGPQIAINLETCSMSGDEPEDRDDEEVDRDEDDSFYDKNSIAEFEMLEKECFQEEGAPN